MTLGMNPIPYPGQGLHYLCRTGGGRIVADAGALCRRCRERERVDKAIDRATKRLEELKE